MHCGRRALVIRSAHGGGGKGKQKVPDIELQTWKHKPTGTETKPHVNSSGSGSSAISSSTSSSSPVTGASQQAYPNHDAKCSECGSSNIEQRKLDLERQKLAFEKEKQKDLNTKNRADGWRANGQLCINACGLVGVGFAAYKALHGRNIVDAFQLLYSGAGDVQRRGSFVDVEYVPDLFYLPTHSFRACIVNCSRSDYEEKRGPSRASK